MSMVFWSRPDVVPMDLQGDNGHQNAISDLLGPLSGVKLVAIGASSYGSNETEKVRNEITRHLFESEGFSVLVIEAACAPCEDIDRHVSIGEGDSSELILKTGYWIWDSTNTLDMVKWMRMRNEGEASKNQLKFYGIDIKPIRFSLGRIREYLSNIMISDKQDLIEVFEHIENLDVSIGWDRRKMSPTIVYRLVGFLAVHERALVTASSRREYDNILHHARNVFRFAHAISEENSLRERYIHMKENLDYVLEQVGEEARIVLWSSNMNIVRTMESNLVFGGVAQDISLGSLLSEAYGESFFSIACCFGEGEFRSRESSPDMTTIGPVQTYRVGPAPIEYLEHSLAQVGLPAFGINLREQAARITEDAGRFVKLRSLRSAYSPCWIPVASPEVIQTVDLCTSYDALVFVNESHVATQIGDGRFGNR